MGEYLHSDLTGVILAGYYAVYNRLGSRRRAYSEAELIEALAATPRAARRVAVELRGRGLRVRTQGASRAGMGTGASGAGGWTCWWRRRWWWRWR